LLQRNFEPRKKGILKLFGQILTAKDVSNNINSNKIFNFDLGYKELGHIRTSPNYLN
jgi:hypothetical protein